MERADSDDRSPSFAWNYDRTEIITAGVIHALGVILSIIGAAALPFLTNGLSLAGLASILIYAIALLTMLALSAAYNMWPVTPTKWVLRRFDHSAIYLLIAGTYTPLIVKLGFGTLSVSLLIVIWATAAIGMALKLFLPGRLDRFSIVLYLLLGWSGAVAYKPIAEALPDSTLKLIFIGGGFYMVGVIFHLW